MSRKKREHAWNGLAVCVLACAVLGTGAPVWAQEATTGSAITDNSGSFTENTQGIEETQQEATEIVMVMAGEDPNIHPVVVVDYNVDPAAQILQEQKETGVSKPQDSQTGTDTGTQKPQPPQTRQEPPQSTADSCAAQTKTEQTDKAQQEARSKEQPQKPETAEENDRAQQEAQPKEQPQKPEPETVVLEEEKTPLAAEAETEAGEPEQKNSPYTGAVVAGLTAAVLFLVGYLLYKKR